MAETSTIFWVFGMTQSGIEPRVPDHRRTLYSLEQMALNHLQGLMIHKAKPTNQPTILPSEYESVSYSFGRTQTHSITGEYDVPLTILSTKPLRSSQFTKREEEFRLAHSHKN